MNIKQPIEPKGKVDAKLFQITEEQLKASVANGIKAYAEELEKNKEKKDAPVASDVTSDLRNKAVELQAFYKNFKPEYSAKDIDDAAEFCRKMLTSDRFRGEYNEKTLVAGTGSAGGNLIPTVLYSEIIRKQYLIPGLLQFTTNLFVDDKLQFPKEGADVVFYFPGENASSTASDTDFGALTIDIFDIIGRTNMSRKLASMSAFNLVDYITTIFANALIRTKEAKITGGTGTNQPKGLRQQTITQTGAQAGASLVISDVEALYWTLPIQYRASNSVVWLMADSVARKAYTLKDSNGRPLMISDYTAAIPNSIMGKPVIVTNDIPTNLGAGTNESEIWFGDLSYYVYNHGQGMTLETTTTTDTAWVNNLIEVKMSGLNGGDLLRAEAWSKLTAVK